MPASLPEFQIDNEDIYFDGDYKHMPLIWKEFEKLENLRSSGCELERI